MLRRYFIVAFALCWAITLVTALQAQGLIALRILPPPTQWLIGFAPVLAAWWVTRRTDQRPVWKAAARSFRAAPRWYAFAVLVPWVILATAFPLNQVLGRPEPQLAASPSLLLFGVVWLVLAWGEEAGWRAFALPRLVASRGFWRGTTLLGVLWCVWHYPKLVSSPYLQLNAEGLRAIALFSLQIVIANYLICWLYLRSGSVGAATVFHTSWNLVSTVYSFAAMDIAMTGLLALVTVTALGLDHARGRLAAPAPAI